MLFRSVNAAINNLTRNTPATLERLEEEIANDAALLTRRGRPDAVLHFQPIEARIANPWKLFTSLYAKEVLDMSQQELEALTSTERRLESTIDLLTCPKCGGEDHPGRPCPMTTHRMILKHLDQMDEDETDYWLGVVQKELPSTARQLAVQLMARRAILLTRGNSEKANALQTFFSVAQEIILL